MSHTLHPTKTVWQNYKVTKVQQQKCLTILNYTFPGFSNEEVKGVFIGPGV